MKIFGHPVVEAGFTGIPFIPHLVNYFKTILVSIIFTFGHFWSFLVKILEIRTISAEYLFQFNMDSNPIQTRFLNRFAHFYAETLRTIKKLEFLFISHKLIVQIF